MIGAACTAGFVVLIAITIALFFMTIFAWVDLPADRHGNPIRPWRLSLVFLLALFSTTFVGHYSGLTWRPERAEQCP